MQCIYKIFKTQEIGKSNNVDKLDKVLFFLLVSLLISPGVVSRRGMSGNVPFGNVFCTCLIYTVKMICQKNYGDFEVGTVLSSC